MKNCHIKGFHLLHVPHLYKIDMCGCVRVRELKVSCVARSVSMCVCVCVSVHLCVCVCVCVYVCVSLCLYLCLRLCLYLCLCLHTFGWPAPPQPAKRFDNYTVYSHKHDLAQCLGTPPQSLTLPRRFIPDPTFGLLRFSRISTAISAPPLQPTQILCCFSQH